MPKRYHPPQRDAAPVRQWIENLTTQGCTDGRIAEAAGVARDTIWRIRTGKTRFASQSTYDLIMAVDLAPGPPRTCYVNPTATRRRLQHLAVMGWPTKEIDKVSGLGYNHLAKIRRGGVDWVTPATAEAVEKATRALITSTPEPSTAVTATLFTARKNGWVSMFAYDDINDPDETPNVVPITLGRIETLDARTEELRHLLNGGTPPEDAAARAGYPNLKAALSAVRHRDLTVLEHLLTGTAA